MLFTVVKGPTYEQAQGTLRAALKRGVDGIEIRFDTFQTLDLKQIQTLRNDATPIQVLFTLRPASHGGAYQGTEESRLEWIEKLCTLFPDYVDLEHDFPNGLRQKLTEKHPKIKWLTSYHNFTDTPEDLDALFASLCSPLSDVTKMATMARTPLDALRMMTCVMKHRAHHHLIGIAMGEQGFTTRALGPVFGNHFDYTYIDSTDSTSLGQLSIDELLTIYHYRLLNSQTALYALIGSPIKKSLGYLVHNAAFHSLGINAAYVNIESTVIDIGPILQQIRKLPFRGLSVTMPLKESIIPFLDHMSHQAKAIGAVNTIEIKNGKLFGHNTDGIGALNAIEQHVKVAGKKMVIIGSGGAAKAVSHEAVHRGALVTILNRTAHKAERLAEQLNCFGGGMGLLPTIYAQGYEIIVNCTPEAQSVLPELMIPGCYAMDLVYVPQKTPFLIQASQKGCRLIYGYEMFVAQALEQQQIWFGRSVDQACMQEIINRRIHELSKT